MTTTTTGATPHRNQSSAAPSRHRRGGRSVRNVQQRVIQAPADRLGELLDRVADVDDSVWPARAWAPLILDDGLVPGSRGGHDVIRYSVVEYEPGRRVRFSFEPGVGLVGHHELQVDSVGPGRSRLTHTVAGTLEGRMTVLWPLVVRWLHEALLQDLLDNTERAATGRLKAAPVRWSAWVRLLRRAESASRGRTWAQKS